MKNNKSNIDIINDNVKKSVNNAINESTPIVANVIIEKLRCNNMLRKELGYYKRVEIVLYKLNTLKDAVKQKEEDIKYIEENGLPENSKSIVVYSSAGGASKEDRYLELKEKYQREKVETERDIKRIENALDKIREDKYFKIIQLKYLNKEGERITKDEDVAEILGKERSTITRNKKRLINELVTILFPQSIKDFL